ncbi:hypothetical protein G7Y89_g12100 [Cudoniella acicularis]|uniref:BTB domain-containing protein n=1 Tax=Cudoniella acicularis TaxID=354080 RepID=A0A8H4RAQ5_9HELO|nr:hypothetical protein G7Y89_g12100 [Cudoniella acicularis]
MSIDGFQRRRSRGYRIGTREGPECYFCAKDTSSKGKLRDVQKIKAIFAEKHRAITAQVIIYSETVEVFAGTEQKQTFVVHKDLLTLHSTYFSNLFSDKGLDMDKKISITVKPSLFADFVSWIYMGKFLKVENNALEGGTAVNKLWELGRFFRAPAFQNFCMDDCRNYRKASETDPEQPWQFIEGIELMYSLTPPGSLLRSLAVQSLSYKNPLQENEKGSPDWKKWKSLLTGTRPDDDIWVKELQRDFALEAGKDWDEIPPWDDQRSGDYMEEATPLEERWDAQILALVADIGFL